MKLGLQIPYLTWPDGPLAMGAKLAEIAKGAESSGYDSVWLMDHFFQIPGVGQPEEDMLEVYTALGFLAGQTSRVKLGALVTGVTYRHPGILAKQVTTLDVLSGGRAYLGIGAAWFEQEHLGLGVTFPPLKERFQRLEEALQIVHQMWSDDVGPYAGKHYQLAETLNVPQPLTKPHPPILIGGSGEKKTLKFVAKYADACNMFVGTPDDARRKIGILHEHCDAVGRNFEDIDKTIYRPLEINETNSAAQIIDTLGQFAEAGVQTILGPVPDVYTMKQLEMIGRDIIPQIRSL